MEPRLSRSPSQLSSLPPNSAIRQVLRLCTAASSTLKTALSRNTTLLSPEAVQQYLPHSLHPYQLKGVQWLYTLFASGQNGILADEMGLGKTVQVLSLVSYVFHTKAITHVLVIVPTSLVFNWKHEIETWCKDVTMALYAGSAEEKKAQQKQWKEAPFTLLLTT